MTIRGIQLRAVLIPVGVAVFSIAALAWYGFVYIPSQQRYLNERNIRLLRTLGAQIRSKVNNFDQAMDHAVESFSVKGKPIDPRKDKDRDELREYVKGFAPELDVLEKAEEVEMLEKASASAGPDKGGKPFSLFDDPPRVKIVNDEGTHFLYLFYERAFRPDSIEKTVKIQLGVKADIESVVAEDLSTRSEFETLVLADGEGRVIAQSKSGVRLVRLDRLTGAATTQNAAAKGLETLRATGNIADVTIGAADYKLYVQPVQLSLLKEDGKAPEEWALCGLVRMDEFRGASSTISYTYWLMICAALGLLCLAIPLLKLHVLSPRERFHRIDGVLVAVTAFLLSALITFGLLDAQYFGRAFKGNIDLRLRALAEEIKGSIRNEAKQAQLELDKELDGNRDFRSWMATEEAAVQITTDGCKPEWACKTSLITNEVVVPKSAPYPYFDLIAWTDRSGEQRVKWTMKRAVTPFLNIRKSALPYYDDIDRAFRIGQSVPQRGVSVMESPNTGKPLTVFWNALSPSETLPPAGISLATTPLSVGNPVLPHGMQFAVLDITGKVLFHSDPTRNLKENFLQECEENPALRTLVLGRTEGALTAEYLGARRRLFVTPINLATTDPRFKDPQWSLVVFQDMLISETVNLETLTLAAGLFAVYALLLAAGWALMYLMWPGYTAKWFWPDDRKGRRYRWAALLNVSLSLAFLTVITRASPVSLLFETAFVSIGAVMATFAIVSLSDLPARPDRSWQRDFLFARISFLFIVAAVPVIACFQVAYHFEANLLNRRGQLYVANEMKKRDERVDKEMRQLCADENECTNDPTVAAFRTRRLGETWDVHMIPPTLVGTAVPPMETDWLNGLLMGVHVAYNDVATDLKTQGEMRPGSNWTADNSGRPAVAKELSAGPAAAFPAPPIQPDFWFWSVGAMIAFGISVLVRFAVRPLFVLDVYVPPGVKSSGNRELTGNLLLVGPPGSGKTNALRKDSTSCIFDVRTLTYVTNCSRDTVRKAPSFPGEAASAPSGLWSEAIESPLLPDGGILGIDHLEYRFDDGAFRDRLLTFLEQLLYRRHYRVWIASTRNPIDQLVECGATVNLDRWRRLFQTFRLETVGITGKPDPEPVTEIRKLLEERTGEKASDLERLVLDECSLTPWLLSIAKSVILQLPPRTTPAPENVLFEIGVAAEPFYRAIWAGCSKDEKLVLRQLAEESVVNPRNAGITAQLLRSGIVRRDPTFRIMNQTFRRFVLHDLQSDGLLAWEHEGVRLPWSSIATTMLTVALSLIGVLLLTWQQLVDAWIGYVPALAPAVPTVLKLFASVQRNAKPGGVVA